MPLVLYKSPSDILALGIGMPADTLPGLVSVSSELLSLIQGSKTSAGIQETWAG